MTKSDLEQLIEKHGNDIYRFCFHLTGCRYDADDLYQDTLCKAYEIRKRIEQTDDGPDLLKVRNYCLGIAVRLYKNSYRKRTRQAEESLDDEQNLQAKVRNSIQALPLKQRTVIYLFYFADLPIKDISALLRIPAGTVKSRLNKAKSTLKNELEEIWYA